MNAKPRWAFELWCLGAGDRYCASDEGLPISDTKRLVWRVRGALLQFLFGWWRWDYELD